MAENGYNRTLGYSSRTTDLWLGLMIYKMGIIIVA